MAQRLVVADASPLIGLAAAGAFQLIRRLFREIAITTTVRDEVLAGGILPGARELADAMKEGWIRVVDVPSGGTVFADLDAGEASTLDLAIQHPAPCLVLMDEPLGRLHAKQHGLRCAGTVGVLLAAKNDGLVSSVRPFLDLLAQRNFRLSREVAQAILEQANEF